MLIRAWALIELFWLAGCLFKVKLDGYRYSNKESTSSVFFYDKNRQPGTLLLTLSFLGQ